MSASACEVCGKELRPLTDDARQHAGLLVCWACGAAYRVDGGEPVLVAPPAN